jgi:hypothetical protein
MMIYEVPQPKAEAEEMMMEPYYPRTLCIPVSKDMLDGLEVDQKVEVILTGTVKEISARESTDSSDTYEFDLKLSSVKMDGDNEYSKMAKSEEEDS